MAYRTRRYLSTDWDRVLYFWVIALAIFAALYFGTHVAVSAVRGPRVPVAVQEDEPGWDCRTMGNKICGPVR